MSFIKSGGYQGITLQIPEVKQPALIMWGVNDKIIDPKFADQFAADLPDATVQMFSECGHVPHLEQSTECAASIIKFATQPVPAAVKS